MKNNEEVQQELVAEDTSAEAEVFTPIEQHTIVFYGKPLKIVRLPDGRPAVVIRYLCDNMQLERTSQVRRIQRTKAIARDLVYCLVDTESGTQKMPTLVLRSLTYWLLGIDPGRARPEMQEEILRYQQEAADALYAWAQNRRVPALPEPTTPIVEALPLVQPIKPAQEAPDHEHATYYENLAAWALWMAAQYSQRWRGELAERLDSMQFQLESGKAVTDLIPDILERLGPERLTSAHRNLVRGYVQQLSKATKKHWQTVYTDLYTTFEVAQYEDILEDDWPKVEHWFKVQIERTKGKPHRS